MNREKDILNSMRNYLLNNKQLYKVFDQEKNKQRIRELDDTLNFVDALFTIYGIK